ncbi:MAG TPA: Fic family protein [Solirubrobacteraceae bacterium]|nr:Fic family protein [Solirubrobacteraceae bacterium]
MAGLRDAGTLAEREAQTSTLRLAQLAALRLDGTYDLRHLQQFHRFIFQDIYPWAGELRSTPLAKPGSMFAPPERIESYANEMFRLLADERHLRELTRDQFADRLTHYHAEINAVHPFREGNGRAQRAFLRQLALDAGHTLAWEHLRPETIVYASQRSFQGDNGPMRDLVDGLLDLPDR